MINADPRVVGQQYVYAPILVAKSTIRKIGTGACLQVKSKNATEPLPIAIGPIENFSLQIWIEGVHCPRQNALTLAR